MVLYFDPPCAPPDRFPSPFAREPHPIARHAANLLRARLPSSDEGKMFGVLVVRDHRGRIGYLSAFSGMLDGSWYVDGFVPPLFDAEKRDAIWPAGEAELNEMNARLRDFDLSKHAELAAQARDHAAALDELRARHRANRAQRHATRARVHRPTSSMRSTS